MSALRQDGEAVRVAAQLGPDGEDAPSLTLEHEAFAAYRTARDLAWATLRFEDAHEAAMIWAGVLCLSPDEMPVERGPVDAGSPAEEFANWLAARNSGKSFDRGKLSREPERAWGRFLDAHLPIERRIGAL